MKMHSNKNRTRLFKLLLGGVMCASTVTGVASLVGNERAVSASDFIAPTASNIITNVEDMVDAYSDITLFHNCSGSLIQASNFEWNTSDCVAWNNRQGAIYDRKTESEYNKIDYDGNVALYTRSYWKGTQDTTGPISAGIRFMKQTEYAQKMNEETESSLYDGYGVISFRTTYANNYDLSLGMMHCNGESALYAANANVGYFIGITVNGEIIVNKYTAETNPTVITTAGTEFTSKPEAGDKLVVTYGVYPTKADEDGDGKFDENTIYLKVEKYDDATGKLTTLNESYHVDTDADTLKKGSEHTTLAGNYFSVARGMGSGSLAAEPDAYLLVSGIEEPLMTDKYNLTETDYEVNEDETLPALPENYAWVDTTAVYGTSEYAANYSFDYYGTKISVPVTVAVNVIALPRVTLKLMNGTTELYNNSVKAGDTVNFGELTLNNVDTIIGWRLGDETNLLRPDTVFTATAEMGDTVVYNVVDIDMKQYEKASIRTTVDDKGNGGLRFIAMFNTADWAANADYIVNAYGVIVPADDATYYTDANGFTAAAYAKGAENDSLKGMTALTAADLDLTDADGYSLYTVVMTSVKYQNYNRTFASMTYITVKYADGSTATFETNVAKRSVYEIALKAKAAHQAAGNTLYSTAQMEVIDGYIANVVDVEYDDTQDTFTVVDRETHSVARTYALVNGSVEGNVVTLTLTVAADSLLATSAKAPVFITANGETRRFAATVSYADGTATLTVTIA